MNILCLEDGSVLESAGFVGGRGNKKRTSLQGWPQALPHFGSGQPKELATLEDVKQHLVDAYRAEPEWMEAHRSCLSAEETLRGMMEEARQRFGSEVDLSAPTSHTVGTQATQQLYAPVETRKRKADTQLESPGRGGNWPRAGPHGAGSSSGTGPVEVKRR